MKTQDVSKNYYRKFIENFIENFISFSIQNKTIYLIIFWGTMSNKLYESEKAGIYELLGNDSVHDI